MPEKCALSHGSGVLGRDPRDSCRFWSPDVENVCTVTQIRLGEGGGGGYHGGGGVGEPRTGIIYTASCGHGMGRACWLPIRLRVGMACWLPNPGQHGGCDKLLASCSRASPSSMLARGLVKGTHSMLASARGQNISRGLLVH